MPMDINKVQDLIKKAIPEAYVSINDLVGDGDHLQAIVVSQKFEGKSLLEQHQMILNPLRESLKAELHALTLKTYTPSQWEKTKGKKL